MSINRTMDTVWYIQTMGYYVAMNKLLLNTTKSLKQIKRTLKKKQPDTNYCVLYGNLLCKTKNRHSKLMVIAVKTVLTFGQREKVTSRGYDRFSGRLIMCSSVICVLVLCCVGWFTL